MHGSGALTRWMLEHGLVDEITLRICRVVGARWRTAVPDTAPDLSLDNA